MRTTAAIQAEPNNAPRAHNLATELVAAAFEGFVRRVHVKPPVRDRV